MAAGGAWLLMLFAGSIYPLIVIGSNLKEYWRDADFVLRAIYVLLHIPLYAYCWLHAAQGFAIFVIFLCAMATLSLRSYVENDKAAKRRAARDRELEAMGILKPKDAKEVR